MTPTALRFRRLRSALVFAGIVVAVLAMSVVGVR